MKITYDNIIFCLQRVGGISVYWYELTKRFATQKENITFFERNNENIFRKKLSINTQSEIFPTIVLRYLPFTKRIPSGSIFHSSYYRVSLQRNVKNIVTIHDFTYEYFKSGLGAFFHKKQKAFAIKKASGIICVSDNTKRDLLKFFPNINQDKIKVIYNGVSEKFFKLLRNVENNSFKELGGIKYILYIGSRASYKNFDLAVKAVSRYGEYRLVIAGGGKLSNKEKGFLNNILKNRFYCYPELLEEDLNFLYNNAFCLIYPSSYEGFGIPLVEAMKCGCPVISTNKSSIPEVTNGAALLCDNLKADSFIEKIKLLENTQIRDSYIEKGLIRSQDFSWNKCFEETYSFYKLFYKENTRK